MILAFHAQEEIVSGVPGTPGQLPNLAVMIARSYTPIGGKGGTNNPGVKKILQRLEGWPS